MNPNGSNSYPLFLGGITLGGIAIWIALGTFKVCPKETILGSSNDETKNSSDDKAVKGTVVTINTITYARKYHCGLNDPKFNDCIYCDYNATTPIYEEVREAMMPYFTSCFGNPSSSHVFGNPCKEALLKARSYVGQLINAKSPLQEIYFTSCGTESDNWAVDISINHYKQHCLESSVVYQIPKIITSAIEHPAVLNYLKHLEQQGLVEVAILPVSREGFVDLKKIEEELTDNTALVSVMHSNNEVGTIQPIRRISQIIQSHNSKHHGHVLFHLDAAQSMGKVLLDVQALSVDMVTIVGHKYGAPKGIAALFVKQGVKMIPSLYGGGQERGYRGGTENVPYCVALGEASRIAYEESEELLMHYFSLKIVLLEKLNILLCAHADKVLVNGPLRSVTSRDIKSDMKMIKLMLKSPRRSGSLVSSTSDTYEMIEQLPNTVSISFQGLLGHEIVEKIRSKVRSFAFVLYN